MLVEDLKVLSHEFMSDILGKLVSKSYTMNYSLDSSGIQLVSTVSAESPIKNQCNHVWLEGVERGGGIEYDCGEARGAQEGRRILTARLSHLSLVWIVSAMFLMERKAGRHI